MSKKKYFHGAPAIKLRNMTNQVGPYEHREFEREMAPEFDRPLEMRVARAGVRHACAVDAIIIVRQGKRLEAPVSFEIERSAFSFAPAEVEDSESLLRAKRHQLPIHKIVGREGSGPRQGTAVVRQDLVFIEKRKHPGNRFSPVFNDQDPALNSENVP